MGSRAEDAVPECPACRRILDGERALRGPQDAGESPLFACAGCLAVLALVTRYPEDGPVETTVETRMPGSAVARVLEALRGADSLEAAYGDVVADPSRAIALRVPEVFAVAKVALRGGVTLAHHAAFRVQRGVRVPRNLPPGSAGVEGTWTPYESDLDLMLIPAENVERVLERTRTDEDEPDMRFFPAFLQTLEGEAVLVEGAKLAVIGEEGTLLHLKPRRSRWVEEGALRLFRATADLVRPDPDLP